jgi:hypothetical protein
LIENKFVLIFNLIGKKIFLPALEGFFGDFSKIFDDFFEKF